MATLAAASASGKRTLGEISGGPTFPSPLEAVSALVMQDAAKRARVESGVEASSTLSRGSTTSHTAVGVNCSKEEEEEGGGGRRRSRKVPTRFDESYSNDPALRVALERSRRSTQASMKTLVMTDVPSFYPTDEEFADPCAYITKIRPLAEGYGICKVIPPLGWDPPCTSAARAASSVKYKTRLQGLHTLQEGIPFPDGRLFTYSEYKAMADAFKQDK